MKSSTFFIYATLLLSGEALTAAEPKPTLGRRRSGTICLPTLTVDTSMPQEESTEDITALETQFLQLTETLSTFNLELALKGKSDFEKIPTFGAFKTDKIDFFKRNITNYELLIKNDLELKLRLETMNTQYNAVYALPARSQSVPAAFSSKEVSSPLAASVSLSPKRFITFSDGKNAFGEVVLGRTVTPLHEEKYFFKDEAPSPHLSTDAE